MELEAPVWVPAPPGVFLPVQYSTVQYSTTPPRFHHRGVGPAPAGEPPFTMRKEGLVQYCTVQYLSE